MINSIKLEHAAKTFIGNGFNGVKTIKELHPNIGANYAKNKASRMLQSANFKHAVAEQLDKVGMTDDYLDSELKSITSQNEKLSPKLNAIMHANLLKRRLPKDNPEHKHLHLQFNSTKDVLQEIEKINAQLSALTETPAISKS